MRRSRRWSCTPNRPPEWHTWNKCKLEHEGIQPYSNFLLLKIINSIIIGLWGMVPRVIPPKLDRRNKCQPEHGRRSTAYSNPVLVGDYRFDYCRAVWSDAVGSFVRDFYHPSMYCCTGAPPWHRKCVIHVFWLLGLMSTCASGGFGQWLVAT